MVWISSDVCHKDAYVLHLEMLIFGVLETYDVVVDVAVDSSKRLERFELFGSLYVSDVTGMPYLVYILEETKDLGDERPMGVR